MPTSPLKRASAGGGGRLGRLLASLLPPARAGPLPVQTGFPTSLADIVVKNHGRLRNPRRRHRAAVPPPAAAAAAEPPPVSQQRRELSVPRHDAAAAAAPAPGPGPGPGKGAGFSIRPGLLAPGGAVALALLVIWSKQLVAAATLASVALSWIESARTVRPRRPETEEVVDSRSPIREAAESPRPSCDDFDFDDGGSDGASLRFADADTGDLGRDGTSSSANDPKRKQRRRSLRKLLANKLRNGKTARSTDCSRHGCDAGERAETPTPPTTSLNAEPAAGAAAAPGEEMEMPPVVTTDDERCGRRRWRALPLPALVPIILAGLVAGKLPALALAVLCAVFSSSVERVPASGDLSMR